MIKRAFDLVMSALGLLVLSPVLLAIALAIRLDNPGPIFYRAVRVGLRGVPFHLYKFRSMVVDADKVGPGITTAQDARVTNVGRVLRRTKLDELPQLFNVLRGDMSIVGPRPEDSRYVALYTSEQWAVLEVRPGITSLASVRYRNEEALLKGADWETIYRMQIMPDKLRIDLDYVQRASLGLDMRIIGSTIAALFH